MTTILGRTGLSLCLLLAAAAAEASTVQVRDRAGGFGNPQIFASNNVKTAQIRHRLSAEAGVTGLHVYAGIYALEYSATGAADSWSDINAICIEYTEYLDVSSGLGGMLHSGGTSYTRTSDWSVLDFPISAAGSEYLTILWYNTLHGANTAALANSTTGAALQVLAWEAITDVTKTAGVFTGTDLSATLNGTTNRFGVQNLASDIASQITTWDTNIRTGVWTAPEGFQLDLLYNPTEQNLIMLGVMTEALDDVVSEVPAPAALGLLGVGAALLIGRRRT